MSIGALLAEEHLKEHPTVQLMFDKDSRRIAIKPVPQQVDNAMKLNHPKGSKSARLSGSGFLSFCGIKITDKSIVCPAKWSDELGAIVLQLPDSV